MMDGKPSPDEEIPSGDSPGWDGIFDSCEITDGDSGAAGRTGAQAQQDVPAPATAGPAHALLDSRRQEVQPKTTGPGVIKEDLAGDRLRARMEALARERTTSQPLPERAAYCPQHSEFVRMVVDTLHEHFEQDIADRYTEYEARGTRRTAGFLTATYLKEDIPLCSAEFLRQVNGDRKGNDVISDLSDSLVAKLCPHLAANPERASSSDFKKALGDNAPTLLRIVHEAEQVESRSGRPDIPFVQFQVEVPLGQEGLHVRLLCRYYADAANTLDALRYSVPLKAMKRVVQAALDMGGRPVPKDSVLAYMLDELDEEWSGGKDRASTCDDGTAQRIRTEENHPLLRQKPDKERSYDIRIEVRVDADETAVVFDDNTGFMMRLAEAAEERMKSAGRDSRPSTRYSFVDGRRASIAGPRSSMAAERGSFLPPAQDFSMEMYRCLEEEIRFVVELKKKYRK